LSNTVNDNKGGGISLADEALDAPGNLLENNTAHRNQGDGIYVAKGGHTLRSNTANHNSNWGIYANGTNTASGNKASGNGQANQCYGISCS
jgi:parallel beta-helix repeat protein